MAYDEGLAQIMRDDLADTAHISEKKMFGGLCFLYGGHMVCGVHAKGGDGGMFRVGPDQYEKALSIDGVRELSFTGRSMRGLVECDAELFGDDGKRMKLIEIALTFTCSLPPKST